MAYYSDALFSEEEVYTEITKEVFLCCNSTCREIVRTYLGAPPKSSVWDCAGRVVRTVVTKEICRSCQHHRVEQIYNRAKPHQEQYDRAQIYDRIEQRELEHQKLERQTLIRKQAREREDERRRKAQEDREREAKKQAELVQEERRTQARHDREQRERGARERERQQRERGAQRVRERCDCEDCQRQRRYGSEPEGREDRLDSVREARHDREREGHEGIKETGGLLSSIINGPPNGGFASLTYPHGDNESIERERRRRIVWQQWYRQQHEVLNRKQHNLNYLDKYHRADKERQLDRAAHALQTEAAIEDVRMRVTEVFFTEWNAREDTARRRLSRLQAAYADQALRVSYEARLYVVQCAFDDGKAELALLYRLGYDLRDNVLFGIEQLGLELQEKWDGVSRVRGRRFFHKGVDIADHMAAVSI